jgi:hypothetical protein
MEGAPSPVRTVSTESESILLAVVIAEGLQHHKAGYEPIRFHVLLRGNMSQGIARAAHVKASRPSMSTSRSLLAKASGRGRAHGFFTFFCVSEGDPPESQARKG